MRRMIRGAWVVLMAASVAAGAQQRGGHGGSAGAHPEFHATRVQGTGSFVSLPGHAVMTPGQSVFTLGRSVFTSGQSVFTPGRSVFTPGQEVFPPGQRVFTANSWHAARHGWSGGSGGYGGTAWHRHDEGQYHYRHHHHGEYGTPYLFGTGYWVSPYYLGYVDDYADDYDQSESDESTQAVAETAPETTTQQPEYQPPAEDVYRPEYHAAASAPNVVQVEEPTLTVVMKDGTQKQMRNYALTPTTLIDLDAAESGREMKIPLDDVNLTATQKAAAEAGMSFNVPKG